MSDQPTTVIDAEEAFRLAWCNHAIPTKAIAEAMGITRQAVSWRAHHRGLPSRAKIMAKADDETFSRMWLAGVRSSDIARHFGYTFPQYVRARRVRLGLPKRERSRDGKTIGGWGYITLEEFHEAELGRLMAQREASR